MPAVKEKSYRDVTIANSNGGVEGYVADVFNDNLEDYLENETQSATDLLEALGDEVGNVAVLKTLHVEEHARGQGQGAKLLDEFMRNVGKADAIILVADTYEPQADGFDLTRFYKKHGFESVADAWSGPVMVRPAALAHRLRELTGYEPEEQAPAASKRIKP